MTFRTLLAPFTILVAALGCALPAASGAWVQVSENNGVNFDEPGHVRASNGTLHIVYRDRIASSNEGVRHRTLSAGGALGAPTSAVAGWATVTEPDVEIVGGAPTAFWGGLFNTDTANPASSGQAWTSSLAGGAWTVSPTPFTASTSPYASTIFSTVVAGDGQPWGTWTQTSQLGIHTGFATTGPEQNLSTACCEYGPNLGRDAATGELFLNYYSNVSGRTGYFTRRVAPTLGEPLLLAGGRFGSNAAGRSRRMSAAERTTGGVYSAHCDRYPTCTGIRVAAATGPSLRMALSDAQVPTVPDSTWTAAAPNGRMWLSWSNRSGAFAVRSNKALTRWGMVQRIPLPRGADTSWSTSGEGSRGFLDLFSNITIGDKTLIYTQRVRPALTLVATPSRVSNTAQHTISFRLTDAGDAVAGSTVRFRGANVTTNASGNASFIVPEGLRVGRYPATGTAAGYVPATATVTVVAPRR